MPKKLQSANPEETRNAKNRRIPREVCKPICSCSQGMVDDVIDPRETRMKIIQALRNAYEIKRNQDRRKNMEIFRFRDP